MGLFLEWFAVAHDPEDVKPVEMATVVVAVAVAAVIVAGDNAAAAMVYAVVVVAAVVLDFPNEITENEKEVDF